MVQLDVDDADVVHRPRLHRHDDPFDLPPRRHVPPQPLDDGLGSFETSKVVCYAASASMSQTPSVSLTATATATAGTSASTSNTAGLSPSSTVSLTSTATASKSKKASNSPYAVPVRRLVDRPCVSVSPPLHPSCGARADRRDEDRLAHENLPRGRVALRLAHGLAHARREPIDDEHGLEHQALDERGRRWLRRRLVRARGGPHRDGGRRVCDDILGELLPPPRPRFIFQSTLARERKQVPRAWSVLMTTKQSHPF